MKKVRMLLVLCLLGMLVGCSSYPAGTIYTADGRCDPRYSPCGGKDPQLANDIAAQVAQML